MHSFKPIKRSRVSEEIIEQIKQSILLGKFKTGEKLPSERDLAEQFKVSRLSIREALKTFERMGLIITKQGVTGGAYVTELTFEYLSDAFLDLFSAGKISIPELYQVRILMEPEVARLATLAITPIYAQKLQEALLAEESQAPNLPEGAKKMSVIHCILAEMCGNRFYEAIVRSIMNLTYRFLITIKPEPSLDFHPSSLHKPIVKAVLAGDPELAYSEMKKHTVEFGKVLVKMEKSYRRKIK